MENYKTIEEYIAQFELETQARLEAIRRTIRAAAPEATEKISWRMPTFWLNGNLIHFAVHKSHIGIYPGASGVANFGHRFEGCKTTKGAIQLAGGKPLPLELISELVRFRVRENTADI